MNSEKLYNITESVLGQLKAGGADIAYCTARTSETVEFNVDGGEFSLLRTLFDNGLSMTAVCGGKKGSVGSNSFEEESIRKTVESCLAASESSEADPAWAIADGMGEKHFEGGCYEPDMDGLFNRAKELLQTIGEKYPLIVMEQMIISHVKSNSVYRNSNGSVFETKGGYYSVDLMYSSHEGEVSSSFFSSGVLTDNLDKPFIELGSIATDLADVERQLHTVASEGKYEGVMLLSPGCLGSFIDSISENFAADTCLLDGTSIWKDKLNEKVADERITISLNPSSPMVVLGENYTGEGFISEDFDFICEGKLTSFFTSLYVSNKTGHPRAKNTSGNVIMKAGDKALADIIAGIDRGILVGRFSGGAPGINGDFSGVAKNSFLIENGKITGAATETMISGNLADMLNNLVDISRETVADGISVLPYAAFGGITISGK
ncbi:MAG: TldD/PmbA family protein [Clostridia bacterium]|nr:TldD/PmbA family protein [Clostridia bacterium]